MKRLLRSSLIAAAACALAPWAAAQNYPSKPVRLVVPYPPGGTSDFVARLVQNRLGALLGQTIVIDNRGGATGAIGSEVVAHSAPDGYTLLYTPGTDMVLRQYIMKANPVDVSKDFTPITAAVESSSIIMAHPSLPFSDARGFIEYAKKNPGKLNYSSPGVGSNFHLAGELLKIHGIDIVHVPYKGGGPSLAAVIAGDVNLALNDFTGAVPLVKDGRVKGIALIDPQRNPGLPDVPSMNEFLPGYEMPESWFAFFGPQKLPAPIVARLGGDIAKAFASPDVRPKVEEKYLKIITGRPQDVVALIKKSVAVYGSIVKAAGIQPE